MGIFRLKLPDLGEGVVETEIVKWHVAPGDVVAEDQPVVDVMTDKAVVEIGSPVNGTVMSIAGKQGDLLKVGTELIRFEVKGEGNFNENTEAKNTSKAVTQVSENISSASNQTDVSPNISVNQNNENNPAPTDNVSHGNISQENVSQENNTQHENNIEQENITPMFPHRAILTSPSVRRLAREQNIDLSRVPGSGPDGRIEHRDIETFIAAGNQSGSAILRKRSGSNTLKISGLRRAIAKKISAAKRTIPHYSYIEEVDVTELENLREQLNAERKIHQPKLTLLPFVMRALVKMLPDFPHCNARYDEDSEQLTQYAPVHIGIATMTDSGLTVPVVRHCEALDVWQCASEIARLSEAVRKRSATREELTGSTITITSLGPLGGIATTPVINAPETAIIGINKIQQRPVVIDDEIVVRKMMNISASFDHRIVDGYDGARLVQALKKLLETPALIFV